MNRRPVYLSIAGALLCVAAFLFTRNYAIEQERVWVGMSGEARVNWLLAARILLTRMGSRVQESSDLRRLDTFPSKGSVFLAANRSDIDPATATRLRKWVEGGGHLVVAAEGPITRDPLMEMLGVSVKKDEYRKSDSTPDEVKLPDGTRLRVELLPSARLYDDDEKASWQHESQGATRMLEMPYEDGLVTVLSTFRPFSNHSIGRYDHAELLWHLAGDHGVPTEVWLVRNIDVQSLPQWLIKNALPFVIAFGLFLALVLWCVIPRFGPLMPNPAPNRRSLVEHLSAMGRFYSTQGQLPGLIQALRQDCLELLGIRAPETQGQDGAIRLKAAARLTGLRPRELLQAFTAPASTPHEFTLAVRVLAAFRQHLTPHGKAGERRPQRGHSPVGREGTERRRDHKTRAEFDRAFSQMRKDGKVQP